MKFNDVMPKMKVDPETYVSCFELQRWTIIVADLSKIGRGSRRTGLQSRAGHRATTYAGILHLLKSTSNINYAAR